MILRFTGLLLCLVAWICSSQVTAATPTRTVRDMDGRAVVVPTDVQRIVTLGPVPVLNSLVFALGKGDTIMNGLPPFARTPRHRFQTVFAPLLADRPMVQGPGMDINLEILVHLHPDVVLTMDRGLAQQLERKGFAVLVLAWRERNDFRGTMTLLGEIFGSEATAQEYLDYVENRIGLVTQALRGLADGQRPKVLFWNLKTMTQPHRIADWWIAQAGGKSATDDGRVIESVSFSMEDVLRWNPDIVIVSAPNEVDQVLQDSRLRTVSAIVRKRVYSIPAGAHPWGHRTVEQPLTVLWAANLFHPDRMAHMDLRKEMKLFYERFFHYSLSNRQIDDMLNGLP